MEVYAHEPSGYQGALVKVEVDIRRGIPGMDLVGLAAAAVRESRERVRAAIRNSGFSFPQERLLINLAPADMPKEGAAYDLPIALKILAQAGLIPDCGKDILALGELTLDGSVRPVRGILPAVNAALDAGIAMFVVPEANCLEAQAPARGLVYSIASLSEAVLLFGHMRASLPPEKRGWAHGGNARPVRKANTKVKEPDFSDFRGDAQLMRALTVAAAGRHSLLLFGPPGVGKTMAALRFNSLLPDMTEQEALSLSAIQSLAGVIKPGDPLSLRPAFRAPHHSATLQGMVGGGRPIRPGEISLAHKGVLFLDEALEFDQDVLQSLREPMEEGWIRVVRAGKGLAYPADFQLIIAANSCLCGNAGNPGRTCVCSDQEIRGYWRRLGGPLLDRIDMRVSVSPPAPDTLMGPVSFSQATLRAHIQGAVRRQRLRASAILGASYDTGYLNGRIPPAAIASLCPLSSAARAALDAAILAMGLTARACHSVLKVARTIADLDSAAEAASGISDSPVDAPISENALLEALLYRRYCGTEH